MNLTQHVRKWGNGNAVRLPKQILEAANLQTGQSLAIHMEGKAIVLTPVEDTSKPTLQELLEDVTPQAIGGELDWGDEQGLERYE